MGRLRLTRRRRALAGYALGCGLLVAGVWVILGLGFALIVAGIIAAASSLVLADVDEEVKRDEPSPVLAAAQRVFNPTL